MNRYSVVEETIVRPLFTKSLLFANRTSRHRVLPPTVQSCWRRNSKCPDRSKCSGGFSKRQRCQQSKCLQNTAATTSAILQLDFDAFAAKVAAFTASVHDLPLSSILRAFCQHTSVPNTRSHHVKELLVRVAGGWVWRDGKKKRNRNRTYDE